jgi:hypothetical protein
MAHTYKSAYPPGIQIDDGINAYFEEFYKTSDTPDTHEKYAESFTKDATLVMGLKVGRGYDDIFQTLPFHFVCCF